MIAIKASKVEASDHRTLAIKEPPRLRSSWGNRRSATSKVKAGVINTATISNDSTTMTGVTAKNHDQGRQHHLEATRANALATRPTHR